MTISSTYEIDACTDCVSAAVNDEWPDREAEYREHAEAYVTGLTPSRPIRVPDPLFRLLDNERLVTTDGFDEHFSFADCPACGSTLGGNRISCTVFVEN